MSIRILERTRGPPVAGVRGADHADPIGREPRHAGPSRATAGRLVGEELDAGSARRVGAQTGDGDARVLDMVQTALRGTSIARPICEAKPQRVVEAQARAGVGHGQCRVIDAEK